MVRADLNAVMSTVESLLAGALDTEQMPDAVDRLRQLFDGSKACLARFGNNADGDDTVTTNPDPELQRRCGGDLRDDFAFLVEGVARVPVGDVYGDTELFGTQTLRESRAWREWMAPQDMYGGLGCRLLDLGQSYWVFDVQRGRGQDGFGSDEKALFERLAPVLMRVVELRRQIGQLTIERDMGRHALDALAIGIIVTDARLRLLHVNGMAEELLCETEGALASRGGRLFARNRLDQSELRWLVGEATELLSGERTCGHLLARAAGARGRSLSLSAAALATPLAYGIADAGPCVIIAARPLEPAVSLAACAQRLFALTEAEARVAAALASGRSVQEAAQEQNVRVSTVRTHLARILQKTGTRQQSQLVALLRGVEMPLRAGQPRPAAAAA